MALTKKFMTTFVKILVVVLLLWWMIHSKRLDLSTTFVLFENKQILSINILVWLIGSVFLTSIRWKLLLSGMLLQISAFRAICLNMIGFFFSTVMPGAVGGDLIKAVYVYKGHKGSPRTPAVLSILLDRVIGLYGVFFVSMLAVVWNWSVVWQYEKLYVILWSLISIFCLTTFFFVLVLLPSKRVHNLFSYIFDRIGIKVFSDIYSALRLYRHRPMLIIIPVFFSILIQIALLFFYALVTKNVAGGSFNFALFAAVLPLGLVAAALPLAPGGLGVGHVAFEQLYGIIGLTGGANVFNIVFVGQMSLNLLGFIPYVLLRGDLGIKLLENGADVDTCSAPKV